MPISAAIVLDVVRRHQRARGELAAEGLFADQLQLADYLTACGELAEYGTMVDLIGVVFQMFMVEDLKVEDIPDSLHPLSLAVVSALFEIVEEDYPLVGSVLRTMVDSVRKNPDFHAENAVGLIHLERRYNETLSATETSAFIPTKNAVQQAHSAARLYADICEGIYGLAVALMTFHANVVKDTPRSIDTLLNISLIDRLAMLKSCDPELGKKIQEPYVPTIRNAASHNSLDLSRLPTIKFIDRNREGRIREHNETLNALEERNQRLSSLSNVIMNAATILGWHPVFRRMLKSVELEELTPLLNFDDIHRRYKYARKYGLGR